jgi:hypothetical protein
LVTFLRIAKLGTGSIPMLTSSSTNPAHNEEVAAQAATAGGCGGEQLALLANGAERTCMGGPFTWRSCQSMPSESPAFDRIARELAQLAHC